jgi:hypothetical protein
MINSIIKHIVDSGETEYKGNTNNDRIGDVADTIADTDKDVQSALSNIGQLSPSHPLVQRIQQETDIQDPQIATQYTRQTLIAMKEHANENP